MIVHWAGHDVTGFTMLRYATPIDFKLFHIIHIIFKILD